MELVIPVDSKVTWINKDDHTHTVTSGHDTGYGLYEFVQDGVFNSGNLEQGESFTFHFTKPGRFDHFCVPHPWMSGAIVVE